MAIPSLPAAATPSAGSAAAGAPSEEAPLSPSRSRKARPGGANRAGAKAAAGKAAGAKASGATAAAAKTVVVGRRAGPLLAPGVNLPGLVLIAGRVAAAVRGSPAAGWATAASATKASELAFLKDPKLSLEEKLIKLLGVLNARWDKELQAKLDKIGAAEKTTSSSTSSAKPKSKGLLGGIADAFAGALGAAGGIFDVLKIPAVKTALKKLGGPALAAAASALGFPAAAPALLKYGPDVVNAALGIASAAGGSSKTSQATSSSGTALNDSDRQAIFMEIQNIRQKQQEMFGLVSNILKAGHDTRMTIIGNVR